ncbi:SprT family zinc-dependent metalloprotease [Kushneria aurantia]|uniref:SprT-like domain-containing protein n=1 Tax=Kushneria aurantia TaxID=504092 RepID=A0ABV6G2E5_9GAMM|nr:SprT-like domain-containing protein [Kushneria aurantia]
MSGTDASRLNETPPIDRERLLASVEQCFERARSFHPRLPRPGVWCDLHGRSAGQAHFGRGGLRFNMTLYREQPQAFIDEIVPHEMAHWVVHHTHGPRIRPHGREWQRAMRDIFQLPPRVTHRFDTSRASPAPWRYECRCRTHGFSNRRHFNALRGSRYRCRHCGDILRFSGTDGEE